MKIGNHSLQKLRNHLSQYGCIYQFHSEKNMNDFNKSLESENSRLNQNSKVNGLDRGTALENLTFDAIKILVPFINKDDTLCALLVQYGCREYVPLYSVSGNFIYRLIAENHGIDLTEDELAIQLKRMERYVRYVDDGIITDRYAIENWNTSKAFTVLDEPPSICGSVEKIFNDKIQFFRLAVDEQGRTYAIKSTKERNDIYWPIDSNEVDRVILYTLLPVMKECPGTAEEKFKQLLKQHAESFGSVINSAEVVIGGDE